VFALKISLPSTNWNRIAEIEDICGFGIRSDCDAIGLVPIGIVNLAVLLAILITVTVPSSAVVS